MAHFGDDGPEAIPHAGASPVPVAFALAGSVLATFALSWIYGPLERYLPLAILNILAAYGMGMATGKAATALMRIGKINSVAAGTLIGAATGVASVWFGWTAYIWAISDFDWEFYLEVAASPGTLYDVVSYLADNPVWTLDSRSKSALGSWFYYLVWLGELFILVGGPIRLCRGFAANNLLCRRCSDWLRETGDLALFVSPDGDALPPLLEALKGGDASGLAGLARRNPGDAEANVSDAWLEAKGFACRNCEEEDGYVRAFLVSLKPRKKEKTSGRSERPLSGFIQIGVDLEERIFISEPVGGENGAESGEESSANGGG